MSASASSLFDPDSFVDRVAEQAMFHGLLRFEDGARVLTIQDGRGRGKSHLLRLLRHQCKFGNPPVAICYVALDELSPCGPYSFAVAAARALREFDGVDLPGLRATEERRYDRRMGALADLHGHAQTGPVGEGATVAGISVGGDLVINAAADNDPALQERLRDEATKAFRTDLRALSAAQPVVLLVDAYEASAQDLADWIHGLLQERADAAGDKLVLVLAGQRIPTATLRLMLGARFAEVVRSVDQLSSWEPEHVRAVLEAHGVRRYDDADERALDSSNPWVAPDAALRLRDLGEPEAVERVVALGGQAALRLGRVLAERGERQLAGHALRRAAAEPDPVFAAEAAQALTDLQLPDQGAP
jgi:hypothetical protein